MSYLFDTNIFPRLANTADSAHSRAADALRVICRRSEMLCFTPPVLAEFWSVCTCPPSARGGFGLLPSDAERRARVIEPSVRLLADRVATYQEWRQLLVQHTVAGLKMHDARLIASMKVYGITRLLTSNTEDFTRHPDITVVAPQHVPYT
jgi:predicted nucleic acid-binding protein